MFEDAISLATLAPRSITRQGLIALWQSAHADGNFYVCRTTTAGNANLSLFRAFPAGDGACAPVVRHLGRDAPHSWRDEFVVLGNFPCYLDTRCGALITHDAKIVAESLYPSAGEPSSSACDRRPRQRVRIPHKIYYGNASRGHGSGNSMTRPSRPGSTPSGNSALKRR